MPNYRYSTPEYMRRGNTCQNPQTPVRPVQPVVPNCAPVSDITPRCNTISDMPIAMAYVPWQEWCSLYDTDKGLHYGTIFKELNKPFLGTGGC